MLTIWGRASSFNVQKVLWLCDELALPWRRLDAGGSYGVNDSEAFLAKNPNGLVPLLDDDGFTLWESNAILRYLAGKAASPLYPPDLRHRANVDRWLDWQLGSLWPAMRPLFVGLFRTAPEARDWNAIEAARTRAGALWSIVDEQLAERDYIAGAADTDHPRLAALYARLRERKPFVEHVMSAPT